jgi:hypothetical protein
MTKTHAEFRFEKARQRLSNALENLEDAMKRKLHEEAIESRMIGAADNAAATVMEQEITIQNLTLEVNNLQQSLSDLGRETEFSNIKNKIFAEKLAAIRDQQMSLIAAVESDLAKIAQAIKDEEES